MLYSYLFTTIALIFGLHFYKNRYPKEYETMITQFIDNIKKNETIKPYLPMLSSALFNIIYIYSLCEVVFKKTILLASPHIKSLSIFVRNNILNKIDTFKLTNTILHNQENLVLVKSETNDIIVFDKVPDSLQNIKYEKSNMRFLALCLNLKCDNQDNTNNNNNNNKDMTYSIYLYLNTMNFYVVGNSFGSQFFKYYLQHVLNVTIDNDKPFLYTLEIMDQNVKITYINETQTIVIKKDNYEIEPICSNLSLVLESDVKEIQNITYQESLEVSDTNTNTSENLNADEKLKDNTELNICLKSEPKTENNNLDYTTVCF